MQIVCEDGSFYILNRDDKREDCRKSQPGRINTIEDTGASFAVPKDFNRDKLLRKTSPAPSPAAAYLVADSRNLIIGARGLPVFERNPSNLVSAEPHRNLQTTPEV